MLGARHVGTVRAELEAYAQILAGASERLAVWRTDHDLSAERATEYLMNVLWSGLDRMSRD